ncbi:MAG: Molybdopterin-guanine dinucleotide biosynthesis protein MobA [Acidimicrobiia bacterium]|nr:Molybdopterin-guanine dinucleotide biosynthesis protein MobA [Acidimicrobiia bacterium]
MSDLDAAALSWIAQYAAEVGAAPLSEDEVNTLLSLAGVAAHASARQAAPLTCWLAARAGISPAEALAVAQRLAG